MRCALLFAIVLVACGAAWASEPGQPLDCGDWVFLEPGYSCSVFSSPVPFEGLTPLLRGKGSGIAADNAGALLTLRFSFVETFLSDPHLTLGRTEILRTSGQATQIVGYIEDRLHAGGRDQIRPRYFYDFVGDHGYPPGMTGLTIEPIAFDPVNGVLFIPLDGYCNNCAPSYPHGFWIAAINGFAPMFEIFDSYQPTTGPLSFTVPAMPEGFPAADYFDTYYGDLATVGDWSQVQPLQCGYPATPPSVGDYLTVADTLPDPAPGTGRYYVTAVHHQGQVRFGRKSSGGVLSGRDPATLPACSE